MKKIPRRFPIIIVALLFIVSVESKSVDPYKVLGVARDASQREIQKAFHKLSLQYHPDKNKNKGAQEKFAEINNAYDILSDEEKRKNYDLYGDEKGTPGFDGGSAGDHTYFRTGGPGQGGFSFRPDDWQNMGGQGGGSKSFSFSFGGPSSQRSFGFDIGDMFSNFFGGGMPGGSQFGGFSSSGRSEAGSRNSPKSISTVNSQLYKQEIVDKGTTWLLLSHTPSMKGKQYYESIIEEVSGSLQGVLKAGNINCEAESSLCKELSISPRKAPRLFVYSYKASESGSLTEFSGDLTAKSLKAFSQENLPRFSKRVNLAHLETFHGKEESLPRVVLLSTKRDTPVIWRALSGLYHKHFVFYDTEVHDVSDPTVKRLGVDALPAVVGWLPNGEKHILRTGIQVKDMKSSISDLSAVLDGFQKKIKQTASSYSKKSQAESGDNQIPLLVRSTFDAVCGDKTPLCIIGVFRSTKGKEKLNTILSSVSQKSLLRRQSSPSGSRESISYALLDASTQSSFLSAFDKSGFKSTDKLLLAYKPKKGKFAAFTSDLTNEEAERFIGSVLNGDVHFSKTRQKPTLK